MKSEITAKQQVSHILSHRIRNVKGTDHIFPSSPQFCPPRKIRSAKSYRLQEDFLQGISCTSSSGRELRRQMGQGRVGLSSSLSPLPSFRGHGGGGAKCIWLIRTRNKEFPPSSRTRIGRRRWRWSWSWRRRGRRGGGGGGGEGELGDV